MKPRISSQQPMIARRFAAGTIAILALHSAFAAQWSGSVQAKYDLDDGTGYSRHETQTWTLTGGAPTMAGSIALYPAKWHYTGVGSGAIGGFGGAAAQATWTIEATQNVQLAIFVRASDNQLIFRQWSLPAYVADALTYTGQSVTSGSNPPTTGSGKLGVNEWVFGWIEADPAQTDVGGPITSLVSAPPLAVPLNYSGSTQPTVTGTWHFTFGGTNGPSISGPSATAKSLAPKIATGTPTSILANTPKGNSPPPPKPAQDPANFKGAQVGDSQVQLNWDAVPGVTTYLVLGPGSAGGGNAVDGLKVQSTTTTLTGVPAGPQEWRVTSWYSPDGSRTKAENWPKASVTVVAPKNHYRITATHVVINHQEIDDDSKWHGKVNEIFVTTYAVVFDRRNQNAISAGPLLRTPIHGDTNSDPATGMRIPAGTFAASGGIKTGDDVKIWMCDGPGSNYYPMVPWDGDLTNGVEVVVLRPMVWALGGSEQQFWTPYSNRVTYYEHPADIIGLPEVSAALGQTSGISLDPAPELITSGTYSVHEERPFGLTQAPASSSTAVQGSTDIFGSLHSNSAENMPAVWSDRVIVLTREKLEAFLAGRSAGTFEVHAKGDWTQGEYTLFLGIERL